jgi:hypothetical protein
MKFNTESELIDVLRGTLQEIYSRRTINILEEVSLGYGVADLVLSVTDINFLSKRGNKHFLNYQDINIYNLIEKNKSIDLPEIIDITRASTRNVQRSLKKLLFNEYIKLDNKSYSVSENYVLSFDMNFAIEAKLKNWKRALEQAYRYKWFAEFSYVVLDEFYSKSAQKNLNIFEKYNVGLATINKNGQLKRLYSPERQKPLDKNMQMLLSENLVKSLAVC